MKDLKNKDYITFPIAGTLNLSDINTNIYIFPHQANRFSFLYCSLLYTNMKYSIPNKFIPRYDDLDKFKTDYIKEHKLTKNSPKYKKFENIFDDIYIKHNNLSKYNDFFEKNEFPKPLDYYTINDNKSGYFIIDYISEGNYSNLETTRILSNFLNINFNNYDEYFTFFTRYFLTFFEYFDTQDKQKIKGNHFYKFDEIDNLSQKYYQKLLKIITNYQSTFREFIDYIYNYTHNNDLEMNDEFANKAYRFYIYRQTHAKVMDYLINNIKTYNSYDIELLPLNSTKCNNKHKLIENIVLGHNGINWGERVITNNIFSYFYYMIFQHIFNEYYIIKKCKNCNKYFITDIKSTQLYCDNLFNKKQTCKDIGNQIAQIKKQENEKVYGKYRKIYSKKAMLVKRNPDIKSYKEDYEKWKKEAKEFMDSIRNNKKTYEEFNKWLEKNN